MTPPKQQEVNMPCESSSCLVPALKETVEKAESFNREYRKEVRDTLQGIANSTSQMAIYLTQQTALKERVDKQGDEIEKIFGILRKEVIPTMGTKVDDHMLINAMETVHNTFIELKKDMKWFITFALGGVTLVITLIFGAINYFTK